MILCLSSTTDWTPKVDLQVALAAGRVLDVSPYNSFSLTCSSTSPVQGLVSVFTWSEQSSSRDSVELMGNESVSITTPFDGSSELRVTTSVAGQHIIVCSVSVALPDDSMKTNSTQETVPVQGECQWQAIGHLRETAHSPLRSSGSC